MEIVEGSVTLKLTLRERDILANYIHHEMDASSISDEVFDTLRELGSLLAPDWD